MQLSHQQSLLLPRARLSSVRPPDQAGTAQRLRPAAFTSVSAKDPELTVMAQLGSRARPEPATQLRGCRVQPGTCAHPDVANPTEPLNLGWREDFPRGYPDATTGKQHLSTPSPILNGSPFWGGSPPTPRPLTPVPCVRDPDPLRLSPATRSCRSAGKRSLRFAPPSPSWCCFWRGCWARVTKRYVEAGWGRDGEFWSRSQTPVQGWCNMPVFGGPPCTLT